MEGGRAGPVAGTPDGLSRGDSEDTVSVPVSSCYHLAGLSRIGFGLRIHFEHGRVYQRDRLDWRGLEDRVVLHWTSDADENIADGLHRRAAELPSTIQMCDALSHNVPRLPTGVEILLANCLARGRRQFIEVAANFPDECRYLLEMLGQVYGHDADVRERGLTPDERLQVHQKRSGPVIDQLHRWLEAQFAERKTEPTPDWAKRSRICCVIGDL
jgi:hypothetical protein